MKRKLLQLPTRGPICLPCRQPLSNLSSPCHLQKRLQTTSSQPQTSTSFLLETLRTIPYRPKSQSTKRPTPTYDPAISDSYPNKKKDNISLTNPRLPRPHHLHIYATRHNCHITLTRGNRNPLISLSAGNIGFKKAQRGTYDAAHQLGTFVMGLIRNQGMLGDSYPESKGGPIKYLEVVLRDFGPGREAVTKILLGSEGKMLRDRILRVCDGTRLKFGGTRSPKPRRLG